MGSQEPSLQPSEVEDITEAINEASRIFDELCIARHEEGAEEYGAITFLENDVVRMMLEEMADTCNYLRYHAIKLMLLAQMVGHEFSEEEQASIGLGKGAFKGTRKGWS
jgi:hypothetical protein